MTSVRFLSIVLTFVTLMSGLARAEGTYVTRADVEIYGKASFLLRMSPQHSFNAKVDDHTEEDCVIDKKAIAKQLENVLRKNGKRLVSASEVAQFTLHFELFGQKHAKDHCMIGYELGLQGNNARNDNAGAVISQFYDYENSYQLIEIKGIIHAEEKDINTVLKDEIAVAAGEIFTVLNNLGTKVKDFVE